MEKSELSSNLKKIMHPNIPASPEPLPHPARPTGTNERKKDKQQSWPRDVPALIATAPSNTIMMVLLGAVAISAGTSLGQLCCLSFLRSFVPVGLAGWGSGSGLAGIFGCMIFFRFDESSDFS